MSRLTSLLKAVISPKKKRNTKKLKLKEQRKIVQLFNNLFDSGFSLTEMVVFLKRSQLLADKHTDKMHSVLLNGQGLAEMMAVLGFSDAVFTQLTLAEIHGNTKRSLHKIESYLESLLLVRRKLIETGTYPLLLLAFLVILMFSLKNYLLPQLEGVNFASQVILHFPSLLLLLLSILLVLGSALYFFAKRLPRITIVSWGSRLPWLGDYLRLYLTAYYAREWGNLIGQGIELAQIVQIMQKQKAQLFRELGHHMGEGLLSGEEFHNKVLEYPFFCKELGLIIEYGEIKAKLGKELEIYAQETWETFFNRLIKATQLIQPLVFIAVALMIVMIYAAMLLPMYQNIGGNF
nr:competence type IV pilus assembly protein ComGB [Streptococcus pantholopis]